MNYLLTAPWDLPEPGEADSPWSRVGRGLANLLLCALILAIMLSPRFRAGSLDSERAIDVRLQDLILASLVFVLPALWHASGARMRRAWGSWCARFFFLALLATALGLLLFPEVRLARRIVFLGRELEPFVLATLVCCLFALGGSTASAWVRRAFNAAFIANASWFAYQAATGDKRTLLGTDVGDQIFSYGPKLIGESSAFGTGAMCAFMAAVALARLRARIGSRIWSLVMLILSTAGAYLSESRVSLGAIVVLAALFVLQHSTTRSSRLMRVGSVVLVGVLLVRWMPEPTDNRLTAVGLDASLHVRTGVIWTDLLHFLGAHPQAVLTGVGPGALGTELVPASEAHSLLLRAWLDFGLLGAAALVATLVVVGRRAYQFSRRNDVDRVARAHGDLAFLCLIWIFVAGLVQDSLTAVTSSHLALLAVGLFAGQAAVAARHSGPPDDAAITLGPPWAPHQRLAALSR